METVHRPITHELDIVHMVLAQIWDSGAYYYNLFPGSRIKPLVIKGTYIRIEVESEKTTEGEYLLSFADRSFYFTIDGDKFLLSRINDEPDNYYIELQMSLIENGQDLTAYFTWNAVTH
jgi:hypothetical protein